MEETGISEKLYQIADWLLKNRYLIGNICSHNMPRDKMGYQNNYSIPFDEQRLACLIKKTNFFLNCWFFLTFDTDIKRKKIIGFFVIPGLDTNSPISFKIYGKKNMDTAIEIVKKIKEDLNLDITPKLVGFKNEWSSSNRFLYYRNF